MYFWNNLFVPVLTRIKLWVKKARLNFINVKLVIILLFAQCNRRNNISQLNLNFPFTLYVYIDILFLTQIAASRLSRAQFFAIARHHRHCKYGPCKLSYTAHVVKIFCFHILNNFILDVVLPNKLRKWVVNTYSIVIQ